MTELINDQQEISRLAEAFQSVSEDVAITTDAPAATEVTLPGGHIFKDGTLTKVAEIKELNGSDEEAIAKAGSANRALNVILARGLVSLGDAPVNKADLDTLLVGDRDAILIGIRVATFGSVVEVNTACTSCMEPQLIDINILDDIQNIELSDPFNDRVISVQLKNGVAEVALPNGLTNKRLIEMENKSNAEVITELLAGCLVSINDVPSMGKYTALQLGIADRETIAAAIYNQSPGPRLAEVSKACKACGADILLPLSLADLFRL
jgi:hypothetical protein